MTVIVVIERAVTLTMPIPNQLDVAQRIAAIRRGRPARCGGAQPRAVMSFLGESSALQRLGVAVCPQGHSQIGRQHRSNRRCTGSLLLFCGPLHTASKLARTAGTG